MAARFQRRKLSTEALEPRLAMTAGPLAVTEIMYHPADPSAAETDAGFSPSDFDYIELHNAGTSELELDNYEFDLGIEYTFGDVTLAGGAYLILAANVAAFQFRYDTNIPVVGPYENSLGNNGEALRLLEATDAVVFSFVYDDVWHPSADGGGRSLVLLNPTSPPTTWSQAAAWTASSAPGGSPGQDESSFDNTPPEPPQNLTATRDGGTVNLSWEAAFEPDSEIIEYRIRRNGIVIDATADLSYVDFVYPNGTYTYTVTAVNASSLVSDASNSATVTRPPEGTTPAFAPGQAMGAVDAPGRETSGLVASRRNPGVFYIHNDGDQNRIFAINQFGVILATITLANTTTFDAEDIAIGPGPTPGVNYIYLGDIGDNDGNRPSAALFRFAEPPLDPNGGSGQSLTIPAGNIQAITLMLPTGPLDAEALMVDPDTGDAYVLTKEPGASRILRASAASLISGGTVFLTQAGLFNFSEPSAADISPTGREILVRNENIARLYQRAAGQTIAAALAGPPIAVNVIGPPTEPNGEAIAFDAQGNHYYTISEGNDPTLYFFQRTSFPPGHSTIPGDINGDNRVDLGDLLALQRNLSAAGGPADLDGNGIVDRGDAARLAANFGRNDNTPASPSASAAAPAAAIRAAAPVTTSAP